MRRNAKWMHDLPKRNPKNDNVVPLPRRDDEQPEVDAQTEVDADAVLGFMDIQTWIDLETPKQTRYLGDVLASGYRIFLVGATGLGKSQLAHAIGAGIASGAGFLNWETEKPDGARVLVIDGEMPKGTIKKRMTAVRLRESKQIPRGNLLVFSMDRAEEFTERFPQLGKFEPLNTPAGAAFLLRLIDLVNPDVIIFDNVMSLTVGDQKDEMPWKLALPLIKEVSKREKAQVWLDHTGHNKSRQYGANAKAWLMDAVGVMTSVPGNGKGQIAFKLTFDPEKDGKSRHRDEDNAADFDDRIIRLVNNEWSCEMMATADHG
jgi:RecA-family ATPase